MFFQEAEPTSEDEYEVCDPDGKVANLNVGSNEAAREGSMIM